MNKRVLFTLIILAPILLVVLALSAAVRGGDRQSGLSAGNGGFSASDDRIMIVGSNPLGLGWAASSTELPPLQDIATIAAGGEHTCALTTDGGIKCWGDNATHQLGDGTAIHRSTPVDVMGLGSGAAAIAAGDYHTCALTTGGGVKCWGANESGQLGDGTMTGRRTPVDVVGLESGMAAIATGGYHTCALTTGGGVKCWGWNRYGQVWEGTEEESNTPVDVEGLTDGVMAIAAGRFHTCALTVDSGVKCWGANESGQLGDGTTVDRSTPVDVVGLGSGVVAITAGGWHTCALTTGGGVKCWGANGAGQLGNGTWTYRPTPEDVIGLGSSETAIVAGWNHTCVLIRDGGVRCWGWNRSGQLGDGTMTDRNRPVDVVDLGSGVTAIAAGGEHTCALITDSGAKCWGWNRHGQLGDGTWTDRRTPVDVVMALRFYLPMVRQHR